MTRRWLPALVLFSLVQGAAAAADLTVSSAVSLREPLAEIIRESGRDVDVHLGGSATLARQLLSGAPSDLFLSASSREMRRLVDAGLVADEAVCAFASNTLVVVVARGVAPPGEMRDLLEPRFEKIAVANVRTAPLGAYTAQALGAAGLDEPLATRLIPAQHARQVVDYIARGEVDAAIVYATDARTFAERVDLAFPVDGSLHDPIVYQAGALNERGREFLDLVCSDAGRAAFERHGFRAWSGPR